jgi:predicted transcriptional regulator
MTTEPLTLSPAILGFWTRCLRTTLNWSQEALAAAAGVDTRTIQRIESGKP